MKQLTEKEVAERKTFFRDRIKNCKPESLNGMRITELENWVDRILDELIENKPQKTSEHNKCEAYELSTEGDVEGRTSKRIGIFVGSPKQIIQYCENNNIKPYYRFSLYPIDIINVEDITTDKIVHVTKYGMVEEAK